MVHGMNGRGWTVGQKIESLPVIFVREVPGEVFTKDAKNPKIVGALLGPTTFWIIGSFVETPPGHSLTKMTGKD